MSNKKEKISIYVNTSLVHAESVIKCYLTHDRLQIR